jgi:hypothetical protein
MIKVSFGLAAAFAALGLIFHPWLFLPAIFCLILGFGLWIQHRLSPAETSTPVPPREPLTEWNPANAARRGESKAERRRRLRELAQDENASWGRWSKPE